MTGFVSVPWKVRIFPEVRARVCVCVLNRFSHFETRRIFWWSQRLKIVLNGEKTSQQVDELGLLCWRN